MIINYYEIAVKKYHDGIRCRVRYYKGDDIIESSLHSIPEINNILALWRMGKLQGSFAIGDVLAENALFQIVHE